MTLVPAIKKGYLKFRVSGIFLILFTLSIPAADLSLRQFKAIPVMENGRIKPIDTFAINILKQFSAKRDLEDHTALQWLSMILFTPERSVTQKVFLVTNPEVLDSMGIARVGKARNRYSYQQLQPGLGRLHRIARQASDLQKTDRSIVDQEILSLYNRLFVYHDLINSFRIFRPAPELSVTHSRIRTLLNLSAGQMHTSYFQLAVNLDVLRQFRDRLVSEGKGEEDTIFRRLNDLIGQVSEPDADYRSSILTLLPGNQRTETGERQWVTAWALLQSSLRDEVDIPRSLHLLEKVVQKYYTGDPGAFDTAVQTFIREIDRETDQVQGSAIASELRYNRLKPFYRSRFLYGFSFLMILLSLLLLPRLFHGLAFLLLTLGIGLNLTGLILRILITGKVPVSNLFETFVFTGLATALLGLILELFRKKNIGILTGSLAGFVLLMIAGKYAAEGDTMTVLVAVLNSNFWLAIHVVTIILGYAGIVLSGFLGHIFIIQKIFRSPGRTRARVLKNTFQAVYSIQAFGIIFTFLGTVLGGIWADQSWGRFWGWDPKENGALVILLWSALLFHARKAGWIRETGMAYGSVIGVIAVSLAWFGVNLLGVGLHSYGFTSGIARTLFLFISGELLFILITSILLARSRRRIPE